MVLKKRRVLFRVVTVDATRSKQEVLDATDRAQHIDETALATAPMGLSGKVRVEFVRIGRFVTDNEIEEELVGTRPATLAEIAAVNEADKSFADGHPNGTHWTDQNGRWCVVTFSRWADKRKLSVFRRYRIWNGVWSFARVRL